MVVLTVDRVLLHVLKNVVHPPHVPLHAEAESSDEGRPRHHRPGRRLLGDCLNIGELLVDCLVHLFEKADGFQILPAAELVRDPLPFLSGVIEVEHGSDGVHPYSIGVKEVEPAEGAADKELPHLVAAEIEYLAAPVRLVPLPGILVLVEAGAVKVCKTVRVGRKVRRHPVEDHADPHLMQHIHHVHEVLRRSVTAGRGEVAQRLIPPGAVERVFHDGEQLDVREAGRADVLAELMPQLAVGERTEALGRFSAPRPYMHLVDRHRGIESVLRAAVLHPLPVVPGIVAGPDDGGRLRRDLPEGGERISLLEDAPVAGAEGILVQRALPHSGNKALPYPGVILSRGEIVARPVPVVEGADHADLPRVGRPEREIRPRKFPVVDDVRSQFFVQAEVIALPEEI